MDCGVTSPNWKVHSPSRERKGRTCPGAESEDVLPAGGPEVGRWSVLVVIVMGILKQHRCRAAQAFLPFYPIRTEIEKSLFLRASESLPIVQPLPPLWRPIWWKNRKSGRRQGREAGNLSDIGEVNRSMLRSTPSAPPDYRSAGRVPAPDVV